MSTFEKKIQKDNNQSLFYNAIEGKSGKSGTFQFADNRPEFGAHRVMQTVAGSSPRSQTMTQLKSLANGLASQETSPVPKEEDRTGLPDNLRAGIESLSGMSMRHVRVHYDSPQPTQLNAHAYAQGNEIHVAPGQEQHLPHEAWHVVQQARGMVRPTLQMKNGTMFNNDAGLEVEADAMGARALAQAPSGLRNHVKHDGPVHESAAGPKRSTGTLQLKTLIKLETAPFVYDEKHGLSENIGQSAEAYLDPADTKKGSTPSGMAATMKAFKHASYPNMVRGHLINGNTGGPGLPPNMFPITEQANSQHKITAENDVKAALVDDQIDGVYYSVNVYADRMLSRPNAKFVCEAFEWTPSEDPNQGDVIRERPITNTTIFSMPIKKNGDEKRKDLITGSAIDNVTGRKPGKSRLIGKKDLKKKKWGEKGSGAANRSWEHVEQKISRKVQGYDDSESLSGGDEKYPRNEDDASQSSFEEKGSYDDDDDKSFEDNDLDNDSIRNDNDDLTPLDHSHSNFSHNIWDDDEVKPLDRSYLNFNHSVRDDDDEVKSFDRSYSNFSHSVRDDDDEVKPRDRSYSNSSHSVRDDDDEVKPLDRSYSNFSHSVQDDDDELKPFDRSYSNSSHSVRDDDDEVKPLDRSYSNFSH
ncbi:DUF4157 domain-containing protein, partial [Herbaspirillum sp. RV1423]|uniref:eCIS core domain-containing protein n=1 Tax=Herbaspirillum sp. RV1423 TaxID=1443993 RepID=UPI0012DD7314